MWIGYAGFKRTFGGEDKWENIGRLWYDGEHDRAGLVLYGVRFGMFHIRPFPSISNPPFITGDLKFQTAIKKEDNGIERGGWLWCGWMWATDDERGTRYVGTIEVLPAVYKENETGGIFIPVFPVGSKSKGRDAEKKGHPENTSSVLASKDAVDEEDDIPY